MSHAPTWTARIAEPQAHGPTHVPSAPALVPDRQQHGPGQEDNPTV